MNRLLLPSLLLFACLGLFSLGSPAAGHKYSRDVTKWVEVKVPPQSDSANRAVWEYAANYSDHEWRVYVANGLPRAQLESEAPSRNVETPPFATFDKQHGDGMAFMRVGDGWLVGFNRGEWGGSLYWYSPDGKLRYKVSDHQIVGFFNRKGTICAIEGLAHLMSSHGSVIRIERPKVGARWQAATLTALPYAPDAVALHKSGTMLIVTSNSLVSVGNDNTVRTLLAEAPWLGLYPNSTVLGPNERKLYVGMRDYVAEFDLHTRKLRMLVPSRAFRNRLPKATEAQIRKDYAPRNRKTG